MIKIDNNEIQSYPSKLKRIRVANGFTQQELSKLSGINIKSIAAYEQNPEKINKAKVETLYSIADSLNCDIKDIVEPELFKKDQVYEYEDNL